MTYRMTKAFPRQVEFIYGVRELAPVVAKCRRFGGEPPDSTF